MSASNVFTLRAGENGFASCAAEIVMRLVLFCESRDGLSLRFAAWERPRWFAKELDTVRAIGPSRERQTSRG